MKKEQITIYLLKCKSIRQGQGDVYLRKGGLVSSIYSFCEEDVIKAKQWKTKAGAERCVNDAIKKKEDLISRDKSNSFNNQFVKSREKRLEELKTITVEEITLDKEDLKPNYFSDNKHLYSKRIDDGSKTRRNTSCVCCGLILKDVPHFIVNLYQARAKICCFCIERINENMKPVSDKMDSKMKDEIQEEHFLRKL